MLQLITDSTFPAHLATEVHTLSCGLLGLYALSCRAFSYSTTQRNDSTLRLTASWIVSLASSIALDVSLHLEPRFIYTIPWSADHGQISHSDITLQK